MNGVPPLSWRFPNKRVLNAGTVSAEFLVRPLSPEVTFAAFTLLALKPILLEERDGEFFLINLH
jgi:hypothetical protein